jgi:hypothetical protein
MLRGQYLGWRERRRRLVGGSISMSKWLEKWRGDADARTPERQMMKQALARLANLELAVDSTREPVALAVILDLTASRGESLQQAGIATAAMFDVVKAIGSIKVKLIYYRSFRECKAGRWEEDPEVVSEIMRRLTCSAGNTQIARALRFVLDERTSPSGIVFIGDHCEDNPTTITALALDLRERGIPVFVFHEYRRGDRGCEHAKPIFKRLAELSGGAYSEFGPDSADAMRELLTNVAVFSAAGAEGLKQVPAPQTSSGRQLQERLLLLSAPRKSIDDPKNPR